MSRSGYSEDCDDQWAMIRWRGAVASAFRGKKGQAFVQELIDCLDAMPNKRLIRHDLETKEGDFCTLGVCGKARGIDMTSIDPEDYYQVANAFEVNEKLVQEIVYFNDEMWEFKHNPDNSLMKDENGKWVKSSPEDLWKHMRAWLVGKLNK